MVAVYTFLFSASDAPPPPPHTRQTYEHKSGQNMSPNAFKQGKPRQFCGHIFVHVFALYACMWGLGFQNDSPVSFFLHARPFCHYSFFRSCQFRPCVLLFLRFLVLSVCIRLLRTLTARSWVLRFFCVVLFSSFVMIAAVAHILVGRDSGSRHTSQDPGSAYPPFGRVIPWGGPMNSGLWN